MSEPLTIAALRSEMGLSLEDFGKRIGLSSKGNVSLIERGHSPVSLSVALAIEAISDGRIDAAALNDDVRAARAAVGGIATCPSCDRRADDPECSACLRPDCGIRQREAA